LGRDEFGAKAVNLVDSDKPQDVYSKVLDIVLSEIEKDFSSNELDSKSIKKKKYATLVRGTIDRKVVKQTVMTSVYGVTQSGARAQIQARLLEKLQSDASVILPADIERGCDFNN
jgi:DNA-directed RNA polymerase